MAASTRKNLTFFIFKHASNKSINVWASPISLSLSLNFFSTQTPTHLDNKINPTVYDILMNKHDFPCGFASRVASELSLVKNPERVDSMLSFLKSSGFSNAQLQKILNYNPRYLCCNLEDTIKPKIKGFQDEGFSSADICRMISHSPRILGMSLNNNIIPSLSLLKGLLGSKTAIFALVRKYPEIMTINMERTLVANVEFLKGCGLSMHQIRIILKFYPVTLCRKPDIMRGCAEKAKEMGLSAACKAFTYAIATIASMSNEVWELKWQAFRDVGFSDSEILSMFRKEPRAFGVSIEKMNNITKGLVATGRFDISSIADYPLSLRFSFERRYEPRMRILKILESRNIIETWPCVRMLCCLSDVMFFKRFVSPHLDQLSDVDIPKLSAMDQVKRKP